MQGISRDRAGRVRSGAWRSRWAAVGAAVAVTLGAGSMLAVNAASSEPSSFVATTPTRILDTRTDVGLTGPFVSGVAQKLQVTGVVATQPPGTAPPVNEEVVPATATSVMLNVTVVRPSTKGFLSIRPGDASGEPATSNINWAAGGANIANAVTVQLPTTGTVDIYVNGTVGEVLIDVAGYHMPAASGPSGPQSEIPSGVTVTGDASWSGPVVVDDAGHRINVAFPGKAPTALDSADVNFAADSVPETTDDDASCSGSFAGPSAPAGKVCIYWFGLSSPTGMDSLSGNANPFIGTNGFYIQLSANGSQGDPMLLNFSWAYTAP